MDVSWLSIGGELWESWLYDRSPLDTSADDWTFTYNAKIIATREHLQALAIRALSVVGRPVQRRFVDSACEWLPADPWDCWLEVLYESNLVPREPDGIDEYGFSVRRCPGNVCDTSAKWLENFSAERVAAEQTQNESPASKSDGARRKGRPKADFDQEQKEQQIAQNWAIARGRGTPKAEFAYQNDMRVDELDRLLNRVQKRNRKFGSE